MIKVLLVDDDEFIHAVVKTMLPGDEFDIHDCFSVDSALEVLEEQKFDLIITDIVMPVKTGVDFMKQLRRDNEQTPILAITAGVENALDDYVALAKFHANETLPKPLMRDELLTIVYRLTA